MDLLVKVNFYLVAFLLILIGIQDIRFRIISNRNIVCLFLLVVSLIMISNTSPNLYLFITVLITGFVLFICNVIGAGDVKLIAVLALSFKTSQFYPFILNTALLGGVLAIGGLIFFRDSIRKQGVPYGVAISLAFIFSYP